MRVLAGTLLVATLQAALAAAAPSAAAPLAQVWQTTADQRKLLQRQADAPFSQGNEFSADATVTVDDSVKCAMRS